MQFEQKSHTYERYANVQRSLVEWGANAWHPRCMGERVLELGAGTGLLTRKLVEKGCVVTATDLAEGMLREGKKACAEADWRLLDAWNPVMGKQECFDTVASSALLQWAKDPADVLARWGRLLDSGGRLLVLTFAESSLCELAEMCPQSMPLEWHDTDTWQGFCEAAGWRLTAVDSEVRRFNYTDVNTFFRSLHRVGVTSANRLNVAEMRVLMKNYNRQFATETGVYATWSFLRLEAERV